MQHEISARDKPRCGMPRPSLEWPPPPTVEKGETLTCEDPLARLTRAAFSAVTLWGACLGGEQSTRREERDQDWKEGGSRAAVHN